MQRIVVNCQTGGIETVEVTPEDLENLPQIPEHVKTKVFKADIWRRATEDEAEAIDALLNAQPVKLRRLWADINFLTTTDPLYPQVLGGAVQLFGQPRAEELLEPTE